MRNLPLGQLEAAYELIVARAAARLRGEDVKPLPGGDAVEAKMLDTMADGLRKGFIRITPPISHQDTHTTSRN